MQRPCNSFFLLALMLSLLRFSTAEKSSVHYPPPVSLLRQSSVDCPCQCTAANPKTTNICAGAANKCSVFRCAPRIDGFECCDEARSTAGNVPSSPEDAVVLINDILALIAILAPGSAGFIGTYSDTLGECSNQLVDLADTFLDTSMSTILRQIGPAVTTREFQSGKQVQPGVSAPGQITLAEVREYIRTQAGILERIVVEAETALRNLQ